MDMRGQKASGCVPTDVDPSHDTGRVQLLEQTALTTAKDCYSPQVVPSSKAEGFML